MLLLLAEYLQQFHTGFGVFQYLTMRGILGVLPALARGATPSLVAILARGAILPRGI